MAVKPLGLSFDDREQEIAVLFADLVLPFECSNGSVDRRERRSELVGRGGDELGARLLERMLLRPVAQCVDAALAEVDGGDGEPALVAGDHDGHRDRFCERAVRGIRGNRVSGQRLPAGDDIGHRRGDRLLDRDLQEQLGGAIPVADDLVPVDEDDRIADIGERPSGIAATLRFAVQERVLDRNAGAVCQCRRQVEVGLA